MLLFGLRFGVSLGQRLFGLGLSQQSIRHSWAHMLCRMCVAEPCVIGWSGVGVVQNAIGTGGKHRIAEGVLGRRWRAALGLRGDRLLSFRQVASSSHLPAFGPAGTRDQVDAVAVSLAVREVVSEVGANQ